MLAIAPESRRRCPPLSPEQLRRLYQTAGVFAEGAGRHLGLSWGDRSDLCQEIILQVLLRLRHLDEEKAPFGAFIDLVARRAAERLKAKIARRWAWELLVDPSEPDYAGEGDDGGGYSPFCAEDPRFALVDFRHDLKVALDRAPPRIAQTFALPGGGSARRPVSRATWFRHRVELRRWLLAHGLAPPH